VGKKRPVKRPTEDKAWSALNREAKFLGVELVIYLRFLRERGQVVIRGRVDPEMRRSLLMYSNWQRDRDAALFS